MEFKLRYFGSCNYPPTIIELTASNCDNTIRFTEDILGLNSKVSEHLIANLREVADELEEHNKKVDEYGIHRI